jgi:hypothetical protein
MKQIPNEDFDSSLKLFFLLAFLEQQYNRTLCLSL